MKFHRTLCKNGEKTIGKHCRLNAMLVPLKHVRNHLNRVTFFEIYIHVAAFGSSTLRKNFKCRVSQRPRWRRRTPSSGRNWSVCVPAADPSA